MYNKKVLDRVALFVWITLILVSGVKQTIASIFSSVGYFLISYLLFFYFLLVYGKRKNRNGVNIYPFLLFLFIYTFLLQFYSQGGISYVSMGVKFHLYVWNLITTIPCYFSALCILRYSDEQDFYFIKKAAMWELLILAISTISILSVDPMAAKLTAVGGHESEYFLLMGYGIIYGLACIMPLLFWNAQGYNKKILPLCFVLLLCLCVLNASYTIAILGGVVGLGVYLILRIKDRGLKFILIITVLLVFVWLLFTDGMALILEYLAAKIPLEEVSKRFEQIAVALRTGETYDTTVRFDLYIESLDFFIRHPIIGNVIVDGTSSSMWGHSTNLDILAGFGIIVFGLYLSLPINVFRYNYNVNDGLRFKSAVISMFIVFLFLSTFNPILSGTEIISMFILAPAVISSRKINNEKNITSSSL